MAYAFYTRPRGGEMISIEERWSRSDTVDFAFIRRSHDYGRTWTAPVARATGERRPDGMLRRQPRCGFVDRRGAILSSGAKAFFLRTIRWRDFANGISTFMFPGMEAALSTLPLR